ncbi:AraC family transcriptional regulator [Saccharopolyspora sp. WRP15-2]|uniref:AraC family transcriptional regulator n=1 Tax=Saccharopolyspora oryzae TaxID=2997343 RepID=A0ABT4V007_9PSEU|nr:AraC family transcriptional regulator [Saccharopolyspora oryzae]MDA3627300.1 AraC family transcriptional regulator [Saccharopolyspora oryzae]
MDVLSDVITVMRTGDPSSARVERVSPWRQRLSPAPGTAAFEVVLAGSYRMIPAAGDPVALGAGDVLFLPHGGHYELADSVREGADGTGSPTTVVLCGAYRLDADRGHPLLDELPDVVHLPARLGRHPRLRAVVDLLGAELESPGPGSNAVVSALLETLLLYVLRAWLEDQPVCAGPTGWAAALADPVIRAALDAIHHDPARPWTVRELATCGGASRAAFARRFTALVGRPPLTYLTWWRLTTAARLLRDSDAPLSVVAAQVGYGSEYAFANAFRREFTIAPGRYRHGKRLPRQT